MTYIRIKKIHAKQYAYLVENISTKKGPRQKVKKYLGRVFESENSKERDEINEKTKKKFIQKLIKEIVKTFPKEIYFSENELRIQKKSNNKEVVLKINEGYLCGYTIQRILKFRRSQDIQKDGFTLAKHFLDAGLPISQEEFVHYYQI